MSEYVIERANAGDSKFLAKCMWLAERAHGTVGIYDLLGSEADIQLVLEHALLNDESCHAHYTRFFVAREVATGEPVAGACGFLYPTCGMTKSKPGFSVALLKFNTSWTEADVAAAWERWNFLDDCFPDYDDWDNSWFPESVYTEPQHRGKGLAAKVLQAVLDEGKAQGCPKSLITCAVGNNGAKRLYESLGYVSVGEGASDEAMRVLGSPGFHLLQRPY